MADIGPLSREPISSAGRCSSTGHSSSRTIRMRKKEWVASFSSMPTCSFTSWIGPAGAEPSIWSVRMGGEEKRPSPGRWILLAVVLLAVVAFVLPPLVNINRYQHRIADSISRSIGRRGHLSPVKLRLLPLPGFEFSDFSVQEDPQFGSEPILPSSSVV